MIRKNPLLAWLVLGDVLAVFVVTMIGFLDHYGKIEGWRWLTTFFPVLAGWLLIAPWLGVYQVEFYRSFGQVWRPALAAVLSAPLAAWLRGALLNSPILPLFILVMGLTNALGMLVWRLIWTWIARKYGYRLTTRTETHG